jgi:type II restriction/modification system DNA methylase subunit YeeA
MLAVRDLMAAARLDWKAIDPTIFGTLFESGLDDKRRAEMASLFESPDPEHHPQASLFKAPATDRGIGIHYTDEATIMKIIEPVVVAPLRREWERIKADIRAADERRAKAPAEKEKLLQKTRGLYGDFRASLARYRVLDPACGSGNFLALSLRALKDFDASVLDDAAAMGLPADEARIGPEAVLGIEINGYAAELARLTVWITELQWQLRKGWEMIRQPILDKLDGIVRADALLTHSGADRDWPDADVIVGNPPFLGRPKLRQAFGSAYVDRLFAAFAGRVPAEADLVAYWFAKAWERMCEGRPKRVGLVATQAIRRGASRRVLDRIAETATIYDAWADQPWVLEGAAVRVSLICFGIDIDIDTQCYLDGQPVPKIHSDLSGAASDLTSAVRLEENVGVCFQGPVKVGAFDISGSQAREWLQMPLNPNGRSNAGVVRPWVNGRDLTGRSSDTWIIDFGEMTEREAALYQAPFEYVRLKVKPFRDSNNRDRRRRMWWQHGETVPGLRSKTAGLRRVIGTPRVAKHRFFSWIAPQVLPDSRVNVVVHDDDMTFGILQSRFHEAWSLRLGGWHGVGNDPQYTPRMGFETFSFPEGLTPNLPAADYADDPRAIAIADAARRLN